MFSQAIIEHIQADQEIGAGNFLARLKTLPIDLNQVLLETDKPVSLYSPKNRFSINDLVKLSESLASKYISLGVTEQDIVALYLADDISYFLHYLALNRIGAIPACINDRLDPEVVAAFCNKTEVTLIICNADKQSTLPKSNIKHIRQFNTEQLMTLSESALPACPHFDKEDVVLLAHTSGTTGIPKAVTFTHHSFFFGVQSQLDKQKGDRVLNALPHSHSSAISVLMSSLLRGAHSFVLTDKSSESIAQTVARDKSELIVAFPKTYVDLCRGTLCPEMFASVGYWIATGDANHEPHIRKLIALGHHYIGAERKAGSIFIDNLGSSEFGFAMFRNIHSLEKNHFNRCIGRSFEWVEAASLSPEGEELGPYEVGFLGVKSESVTAGYWNNPKQTEEAKLSGYWLTGDLVYYDSKGLFFHVDRTTDPVVTTQGVVYSCLAEELILVALDEVFECSVYSVPDVDNEGYFVPHICVELDSAYSDIEANTLLACINQVMRENDMVEVRALTFQSGHDYTGVTGKKLKRQLRNLEAA